MSTNVALTCSSDWRYLAWIQCYLLWDIVRHIFIITTRRLSTSKNFYIHEMLSEYIIQKLFNFSFFLFVCLFSDFSAHSRIFHSKRKAWKFYPLLGIHDYWVISVLWSFDLKTNRKIKHLLSRGNHCSKWLQRKGVN